MTTAGRDERDEARANELLAGLDAVGWTHGTIRQALLTAMRDTRDRAAGRVAEYGAGTTCKIRRSIARHLGAVILEDAE